MRFSAIIAVLLATAITAASAQVASHAPTGVVPQAHSAAAAGLPAQPVARVNGTVLTERDLLREMLAIFPYARQHNGSFPKSMEPEIRRGALQMIIFEELVFQEAERRRLPISRARLDQALGQFRSQFSAADYRRYLQQECQGSEQVLRAQIRRSLLIEALLKSEVHDKAAVSLAAARAYYDQHPQEFQRRESLSLQTISIIPPPGAGPEALKEAQKRAEEALRQARATKSYREFGLLAEKFSDDDWHVNMGDRKLVEAIALPPPLVQAARRMKPGEVSELLQFGPNYTLFRLNAFTPAGRATFPEVKDVLRANLEKSKVEELRTALGAKLRKTAKVEFLAVEQSRR